jgi:drug/metabolite transporter (DMT)-like permease
VTTLASAGRAVAAPPLARAVVDRPLTGIGLILLSMAVFSLMDGLSKELAAHLPPVEVAWGRFLFISLILLPAVLRRPRVLATRHKGRHVLRGLCMLGSSLFFIAGLAELPIAEAAAIGFVSPFMITALSIPLLGEHVGVRRWSAVAAGFIGVLVVIRPGSAAFDPAAFYPVASAVCWALGIIITRQMQGTESVLTTMAWSNFVGFAVLVVAVIPFWQAPTPLHYLLMAAMGALSTGGQVLLIASFRYAGASLLSPFSYSQMLWATLIGYFAFGQLPDALTWTGAAIIIASGVYTLHRERVRARERSGAGGP